jgi:predicted alpha/beta-fold hydrolase
MSELTRPSIVLVHGLWADASSFNRIIPALQEEGYEVFAPQFGLDTLASDVEAVRRAFSRVPGPILLVGHSYGGTLVTVWATHAAPAADTLTQKVEGTAWKTKPSWYVLIKDDRVAHPALQHFVARRMGATDGGHIGILSNPDLALKVICEAAKACSRARVE